MELAFVWRKKDYPTNWNINKYIGATQADSLSTPVFKEFKIRRFSIQYYDPK
jgi:hypothetical protein